MPSKKSAIGLQYYSKCVKQWVYATGKMDELLCAQVGDQKSDKYTSKEDILFYRRSPKDKQNGDLSGILSWSAGKEYFIYSEIIKGHPVQYYRVSKTGKLTQKLSDKEQSYILYG